MATTRSHKTPTPRPVPVRRVPRPIIALAAPTVDQPTVSIDRLKGGEINWSIKVPGASIASARARAVEEAKRLIWECGGLELLQADLKQKRADAATTQALEKSLEKGGGQ